MQVLIGTLAQSKMTSNVIERKVKEAAKTQEIIAKTRIGYMPIAFRASQLFFCIADLGTVDPMYQVRILSTERRILAMFQRLSLRQIIVLRVIDCRDATECRRPAPPVLTRVVYQPLRDVN